MRATEPTTIAPKPLRLGDYALLVAFCGLLFFLGLGHGELWRTEGLRGLVARAMFETGDWIVPRLYGEPHFTKPPGFYLAVVLCSLPFGQVTEFSARLPSAIAASLGVLLFAWYFGRQLGRRTGIAAGLILPMSLLWLDKSSAAEIDMMQVLWISASILFFLRAVEPEGDRAGIFWFASLLCVAAGFLTKWTAPQFFYFFAVPYLAYQGRLQLLARAPHLISLAVAVSLSMCWIVAAIGRTSPEIFFGTVLQESLPRFVPTHYERAFSVGEALLLPIKFWASALPWSLPALIALRPGFSARLDERGRTMLLALHCWLWPSLGFWMLANEHASRHSFPLAPALAGFAVLVWHAWDTGRLSWTWTRLRPASLLVVGCVGWMIVKLVFVTAIVPLRAEERQARRKGEQVAAFVPRGTTVHHALSNSDESLLFYCGRSALRHRSFEERAALGSTYWFMRLTDWNPDEVPGRIVGRLRNEAGQPAAIVEVFDLPRTAFAYSPPLMAGASSNAR